MFTPNQIQEIVDLLDNTHWMFIAKNVNANLVPKNVMKDLIKMGFNKNQVIQYPRLAMQFGLLSVYMKDKYVKNLSFHKLKQNIKAKKYLPFSEAEEQALRLVEMRAMSDIKGLGNRVSQSLQTVMIEADSKQRAGYEKIIKDTALDAIKKRERVKFIRSEIGHKTGDWARDLDRIADYLLHEAYDTGRALVIVKEKGEDALVYKRVHKDACKHCQRLFLKNLATWEPKIFKVGELLANGTNIGKKVNEYLPVVGSVHPWCFLNPKIKIYTSEGWKNIKDIKINDEVMTHKGRFRKVTKLIKHKFDKNRDNIYNLVFDINGKKIEMKGVTGTHPFKVGNQWKRLENIEVGQKLKLLHSGCNNNNKCGNDIPLFAFSDFKSSEKNCSKSCHFSLSNIKNWKDDEYRKKMLKNLKKATKRSHLEEFKQKRIKSQKETYEKMGFKGRQELTKKANDKIREMWKEGKLDHTLENLKKVRKSYTFIEKKMAWLLETMNINFEQQKMLKRNTYTEGGFRNRRYFLDFYLPDYNLAIECNGNYYHQDREKDLVRAINIKILIGAETLLFGENEIRNKLSNCREKIERVINNHNGNYNFKDCILIEKKLMNGNVQSLRNYGNTLYNFSVEDDESYIANGIVVHNCRCDLEIIPVGFVWSDKTNRFVQGERKNKYDFRSAVKVRKKVI